jgi:hypothetical protein
MKTRPFTRLRIVVTAAIGFLSQFSPLHLSRAATAVDITLGTGTPYQPGGLTHGWEFSVAQPIQITHWGLYDHDQDGFEQGYGIYLWSSTGILLSSAAMPDADAPLAGLFRYVSAGDLTLAPGTYVIGFQLLAENLLFGDWLSGIVAFNTDPAITYVNGRVSTLDFRQPQFPDMVLTQPAGFAQGFGANFQFVAVPEPSTLMLVAFGLVTAGALRMWRRKHNERHA